MTRRRVTEQLRIEFNDRVVPLSAQLNRARLEAIKAGSSVSGRAALNIASLYQGELKVRGDLTINTLRRVSDTVGIAPDAGLSNALKELVLAIFHEQSDRLRGEMLQDPTVVACIKASPGVEKSLVESFQKTAESSRERAISEAELFCAKIEASASREPLREGVVVSGTGNVVQVGSFSNSPMTIQVDATNSKPVEEALAALDADLSKLPEGLALDVSEAREIVDDARRELAKPKPNKIKLGSLLSGLASSIQTTAALQPAYQLLKGALAGIGIPLP